MLIVPNAGVHERAGGTVLVAWNGRREAARAVFDLLPILRRAKSVKVVLGPQSEREITQEVLAADVSAVLAQHAVECEATKHLRPRGGVGKTSPGTAKDCGADLLVMGCYGHTRLREFVSGASRYVLAHMSVPVLMSH